MKHLIKAAALAAVLGLGLSACGHPAPAADKPATTTASDSGVFYTDSQAGDNRLEAALDEFNLAHSPGDYLGMEQASQMAKGNCSSLDTFNPDQVFHDLVFDPATSFPDFQVRYDMLKLSVDTLCPQHRKDLTLEYSIYAELAENII